LPSSAELVDLSYETLTVEEGVIAVRLVVSAEEEIGGVRPWPLTTDPDGG
jgi:hypothetical protein